MLGTGSVLWLPLGVGMIQRTSHLQSLMLDRIGDIYSSEHLRRSSQVSPVTFLPVSPQLPNHKFLVFLLDSHPSNLFVSLHGPLLFQSHLSKQSHCSSFTLSNPFPTLDRPFCNLLCQSAYSDTSKVAHCGLDIGQIPCQDVHDSRVISISHLLPFLLPSP